MGAVELLDDRQRPLRATPGLVLAAIVALATFGIWGYAYSGLADRPPPDLLDDRSFAEAAESRCAAAVVAIGELEPAYAASDHLDRARTVDEANAILADLLVDLRALTPGTARDTQIVGDWLSDWETYLADRRSYADRLAADAGARFYQTNVAREPLDRRLTRMATTNAMPSCGASGDVG